MLEATQRTIENFGERIGDLEKSDAVQSNRLDTIDGTLKDIKKALGSLPWKLFSSITGGVMVVLIVLDYIKGKF